jgi:hypothetical protein
MNDIRAMLPDAGVLVPDIGTTWHDNTVRSAGS